MSTKIAESEAQKIKSEVIFPIFLLYSLKFGIIYKLNKE